MPFVNETDVVRELAKDVFRKNGCTIIPDTYRQFTVECPAGSASVRVLYEELWKSSPVSVPFGLSLSDLYITSMDTSEDVGCIAVGVHDVNCNSLTLDILDAEPVVNYLGGFPSRKSYLPVQALFRWRAFPCPLLPSSEASRGIAFPTFTKTMEQMKAMKSPPTK